MSREKGSLYELRAGKYLEGIGYKILQYNYQTRYGEIDIIAEDPVGRELVFVEVKYRKYEFFGGGASAITREKMRKIVKTSRFYLSKIDGWERERRYDLIIFHGESGNLEHIKNEIWGDEI